MSLPFTVGDIVDWTDPDEDMCSGRYEISQVYNEIIVLTCKDGREIECYEHELKHVKNLFAVYHHHEYGSTQWLIKSSIFPNESQIVDALGLDFEPERGEFIAIEEITEIHPLELS